MPSTAGELTVVDCSKAGDGRDGARLPIRRSSPAIAATPAAPRAILLRQQRPAHRDPDRPQPLRSARTMPPASPTSCSKPRSPRSWICEDSIAAVDAEDKVAAYRNWLGLMKGDARGDLRQGRQDDRRAALNPDRVYTTPDGGDADPARPQPDAGAQCRPPDDQRRRPRPRRQAGARRHPGRAWSPSLIALHDLKGNGPLRNSRAGSIYIVKPKMHGPEEVAFADELFDRVEDALGPAAQHAQDRHHGRGAAHHASTSRSASAPPRTASCFINTGFLDRTGDEIHTSMEAGPMIRKGDMKATRLDQGLRGLERRHRAGLRPARPAPRSARACGRCPT